MCAISLLVRTLILSLFIGKSYLYARGNFWHVFWLLVQHLKMRCRWIPWTVTPLPTSNLVLDPSLRLSYRFQQVERDNWHSRFVDLIGRKLRSRIHWRCLSIERFFYGDPYCWWNTSTPHDLWTTWTSDTRGNVENSSMRTQLLALLFRRSSNPFLFRSNFYLRKILGALFHFRLIATKLLQLLHETRLMLLRTAYWNLDMPTLWQWLVLVSACQITFVLALPTRTGLFPNSSLTGVSQTLWNSWWISDNKMIFQGKTLTVFGCLVAEHHELSLIFFRRYGYSHCGCNVLTISQGVV